MFGADYRCGHVLTVPPSDCCGLLWFVVEGYSWGKERHVQRTIEINQVQGRYEHKSPKTGRQCALITGPHAASAQQSPNDHPLAFAAHADVCYTTKSNYKQTTMKNSYESRAPAAEPPIRYSRDQNVLLATATKSRCVCPLQELLTNWRRRARTLLDARKSVRGVTRDSAKGEMCGAAGCEVALARMETRTPCNELLACRSGFRAPAAELDPCPGFIETRQIVAALHAR